MNVSALSAASRHPKSLDSGLLGFVDILDHVPGEGWTIAGWARSSAAPAARFSVAVLCHGDEVARVTADGFRQDLLLPGQADGHHAFSVLIPDDRVKNATISAFNVVVLPDRLPLPLADHLASAVTINLRASVDIVGRDRVAGWLLNEKVPEARLSITVLVDNTLRHRTIANKSRPDLRDIGLGDGRYGFDIMLDPPLSADTDHTVSVICSETGEHLPGSPIHFPANRRFNETFRQHVKQTLSGIASGRQREAALEFLASQADMLRGQQGRDDSRETATILHRSARRLGEAAGDVTPFRVLFIDDRAPDPSRDAGSGALLSHMRAARDLGHEVSFMASAVAPSPSAVRELEKLGFDCWHPPTYPTIETLLKSQHNSFDAIYFHRLSNANRYLALARSYIPATRLIASVA